MSVGNPEQFKFKILTTGREDVDNRKPCNLTPLNLEKLLKWIDAQRIDENTKQELKKSASNYPHQALGVWQKNYSKHVAAAQAKLKKLPKTKPPVAELGDEPTERRNESQSIEDTKSYDDFESDFADEFENPGGN